MNKFQLQYKQLGSSALLIEWPPEISNEILNDIRFFVSKIEDFKEIVEYNFIYSSLLIVYNKGVTNFSTFSDKLNNTYKKNVEILRPKRTLWEIPVCYNEEFGIDLNFLSLEKGVSINEIVSKHSAVSYTVYGIGFLPGFLYLGGLDKKIHSPRRNTPRLNVLKGSVGIGGSQTGIYPQTSPGGWHIIGKTPLNLFEVNNEIPCFIRPADEVKFIPILKDEFYFIEQACNNNSYEPNKFVIHD